MRIILEWGPLSCPKCDVWKPCPCPPLSVTVSIAFARGPKFTVMSVSIGKRGQIDVMEP